MNVEINSVVLVLLGSIVASSMSMQSAKAPTTTFMMAKGDKNYITFCITEDKVIKEADDPAICDREKERHLQKNPSHQVEVSKTFFRTGGGLHNFRIIEQWGPKKDSFIRKPNVNHDAVEVARCMLEGLQGRHIDGWCADFYREVTTELYDKGIGINKLHFICDQHPNDHHTIEQLRRGWNWICADHR